MTISRLPDNVHSIPWQLAAKESSTAARALRALLLAIALPLLLACKPSEPPPPSARQDGGMVPLRVGILNYTDHYLGVVYVNNSWAGNSFAHSGGGKFAGSAEVPRQWDPNYKLTIHWRDEALYEKDKKGLFKREVATEPYQQETPGGITFLWVAFFPGDVIKLYPTLVAPGHPDFPGGLLEPTFQCRKERPGTDWCEHSGWVKRHAEQQQTITQEAARHDD